MDYQKNMSEDGLQISLSGKLGFDDSSVFRQLITELSEDKANKTIVFDLSELESIDSAGLGMLLLAADTSSNEGWSMKISGASNSVRKMIELTHVDQVVDVA